jgi:hypothetical protein
MITKRIINIFTFGLFLLAAGLVGSLFDWAQAKIIMAIGLVFELLAVLMYIWGKIRKS